MLKELVNNLGLYIIYIYLEFMYNKLNPLLYLYVLYWVKN